MRPLSYSPLTPKEDQEKIEKAFNRLRKNRGISDEKNNQEDREMWETIWQYYNHQDDVYPYSFSVPQQLVDIAEQGGDSLDWQILGLPLSIEVARQGRKMPVPAEYEEEYTSAMRRLFDVSERYINAPAELGRMARGMLMIKDGKYKEADLMFNHDLDPEGIKEIEELWEGRDLLNW